MFINCMTSKNPELLQHKFDDEAYYMSGNIFLSIKNVGKHKCPNHQFDMPPEIDFHLWSIDQAIFVIKDWAANECHFHCEYFCC